MRSGEEMRSEFEKLEYIQKCLNQYELVFADDRYIIDCDSDLTRDEFVTLHIINTNWLTWKEQQKKIDAVKKHIERIKNFNSKVDAGYDPEFVAGFIDAFIDSMDAVLK